MGRYKVNIKVSFGDEKEYFLIPMIYDTTVHSLDHSKNDILFIYEKVMGIPFNELPLAIGKSTILESIFIQKRLEGFPFPSTMSDEMGFSLG